MVVGPIEPFHDALNTVDAVAYTAFIKGHPWSANTGLEKVILPPETFLLLSLIFFRLSLSIFLILARKKVGILVPMFPLFPNYSVDGQVLPTQQIDNMFKKTLNPGSLSCVSDEAAWGGGLSPRSLSPLGHVAWHQSTV